MADSSTYTPETLQRRYAMAQALLADPKKPITHWAEGLNELAKGALGGYQMGNAERLEAKQREDLKSQIMGLPEFGGQPSAAASPAPQMPAPPAAGPSPAPVPQVLGTGGKPLTPDAQGVYDDPNVTMLPPAGGAGPPDFGKAIAGIESAGQKDPYAALGPPTRTGDRAFGKYQVMGANIPAWTKEHLGQEMTPEQFLANPQAQDAVFKGQFGKYVQQTGNPQDAASMWFSGKPLAQGAGLKDQLGTTGQQYVDKFNAGMGGPAGASPAVGAIASALNGGPSGAPTAAAGAPPSPAVADVAKTLTAPAGAPSAPPAAAAGVNPNAKAIAAILTNPWADPALKQAVMARTMAIPQFTQVGEDMLGNKKFGFVDSAARKVTDIGGNPIGGPGASAGAGNIPVGPDGQPLQGQELLKNLEKNDPMAAAAVKGVIAGDINAGGRNLQKVLPLAELVDPTMKQFDYQTRSKTRLDFTSGKSAQELKAINTAIGHADQLAAISPKLGGTDYAPGIINPITQSFKRNTGDTAFQDSKRDWDTKAETLATEVSKALNGGTPHVADKEHWRGILQAASSPTERASALKSIMGVLQSRIESNAQTYNQGMGTNREGFSFLNKENAAKYQRLLETGGADAKPADAAPAAAAPATPAAAAPKVPAAGEVRSGYRFKGGDPADKANWEQVSAAGGGAVMSDASSDPIRPGAQYAAMVPRGQPTRMTESDDPLGGSSPVGTKGGLVIRDRAHLNKLLNNAEGDADLRRIKRALERQGMDSSVVGLE